MVDQELGFIGTGSMGVPMARRLIEGAKVIGPDNSWAGWSPTWMLGHRIWGKRLGIIGMGRIGTAVARRAKAFGLQIHYHNRKPVHGKIEEELEATYWESLDQMLARMGRGRRERPLAQGSAALHDQPQPRDGAARFVLNWGDDRSAAR